jgi:hypothetical protein
MAGRGWIASIAVSVGVAAGATAAQFGLGYGLGVISWVPGRGETATTDSAWLSGLAWTTWIAAIATVLGAVVADRRSAGEIGAAPPRSLGVDGPVAPPGILATAAWRALLALAAAVGATVAVALVLVPAHAAVRPGTSTPELNAAGYAIVGVLFGVAVAICALAGRAAATNVVWTAGLIWLLAVAAVADGGLNGHRPSVSLAVWPFGGSTFFRQTWSLESAALMLGTALAIGAGAAWLAARRADSRIGIALSGALGPLTVTGAYLLTLPRLVGVDEDAAAQVSAALIAPYAVIAGLAGSVLLVAAMASREATRRRGHGNGGAEGPAWPPVPPRRPVPPATADVFAGATAGGSRPGGAFPAHEESTISGRRPDFAGDEDDTQDLPARDPDDLDVSDVDADAEDRSPARLGMRAHGGGRRRRR